MITIFGRQFKNFSQLRKFIGYGAITEKMAIDRSGSLEQFVKDVLKVNTDDEHLIKFTEIVMRLPPQLIPKCLTF